MMEIEVPTKVREQMRMQALLDALANEILSLHMERTDLDVWEAQIDEGMWAAELLSKGMTRRDARQWIAGARQSAEKTEERLRRLHSQFYINP